MAQPLNSATVLSPWQEQLEAAPQILVGFSGGLDSSVLLALLTDIIPVQRLCAVHINHGLSNNASDWQSHAEAFCLSLGVRLHSETVAVQEAGQGLEAAAREARYQVFETLLQQDGLLLLGHHADDQVETCSIICCGARAVKGCRVFLRHVPSPVANSFAPCSPGKKPSCRAMLNSAN